MMLPTLKAEFRKLFTVRSTYIIIALNFLLILLFAFYLVGFRGLTDSPSSDLSVNALQEVVANGAGFGAIFVNIVAVLFMAHEYRHNTIVYTLTANTRRSRVLLAKLLVVAAFSACYALVAVLVIIGCYLAGVSLRDADLPPQDFNWWAQLGKVAFYYVGYALAGILLAVIVRSVVGAIASLLVYSIAVEPLLSLLFKGNTKYLPIASLDSVVGAAQITETLTAVAAIGVSSIYLAVGVIVAWVLFVRRDAM